MLEYKVREVPIIDAERVLASPETGVAMSPERAKPVKILA
jgi:hypothetical protein